MEQPQVKLCSNCGADNQPDFSFCRKCGLPLAPQSANAAGAYAAEPGSGYQQPDYTVDGIPVGEVYAYVGNNADKIAGKFIGMERTGSKVSWNWPVFLTMLFGGPIVGACWFLYRRMNKIALWLILGGVVLWVTSIASAMPMLTKMEDFYQQIFYYSSSNYDDPRMMLDFYRDFFSDMAPTYLIGSILSIIQLAATIVLSIYANYLHKNHVTSSIRALHEQNPAGVTPQQLMAAGGVKNAGWIILVIVFVVAEVVLMGVMLLTMMDAIVNALQYGGLYS